MEPTTTTHYLFQQANGPTDWSKGELCHTKDLAQQLLEYYQEEGYITRLRIVEVTTTITQQVLIETT